jgi:hypothetical protein
VEEKGQPAQVHKQANQNLIIDETVMEFSQSVLSIVHADQLPASHTVDWGETPEDTPTTEQTIDGDAGSQDNEEQAQTEQGQDNEELAQTEQGR